MLRKALFSFEKYLQQVHFKCQRHSQMKELESIHQLLDLYIWLSFRFEDSFPDHELASLQKAADSI
ncbi:hypothetical protein SLEP1_g49863 [Rubroshorea leprosula]|uniref:ATP-dependent RNA helicase SUV3 C-terminal domain-containing protein n=1 Tax=Rubroshorea leprosula TaxID=152421 RepID=A0AAV5LZ38_9ROSI|nr:hypothetical protein SLEP1_g49863 [Rubroshorea leprosula]